VVNLRFANLDPSTFYCNFLQNKPIATTMAVSVILTSTSLVHFNFCTVHSGFITVHHCLHPITTSQYCCYVWTEIQRQFVWQWGRLMA